MSQINTLNQRLSTIDKNLKELEKMKREKNESIVLIENKIRDLNTILNEEKKILEDSNKKILSLQELKNEADSYYKQIEQGVDTLLNILDSSLAPSSS